VCGEQRLDFRQKPVVGSAGIAQKGFLQIGFKFRGGREEFFNLFPVLSLLHCSPSSPHE
jgi:hypothetical protein